MMLTLVAAEFVIHYLLDFAKVHYSRGITSMDRPRMFWGLYGLDQLFHQVTYIGLTWMVVMNA